jgi:hypothetical protein
MGRVVTDARNQGLKNGYSHASSLPMMGVHDRVSFCYRLLPVSHVASAATPAEEHLPPGSATDYAAT